MKEGYKDLPLHKNENLHLIEMNVNGNFAFIEYNECPSKITSVHTKTDPPLAAKGAATGVIEKTRNYIEQKHLKLIPLCPLFMAYIKRYPEWKRIVDVGVTVCKFFAISYYK